MDEDEDVSSSNPDLSQEDNDGSQEDSEYEELVSSGREDHPLVKFKRLISSKTAQLQYHYNPDVPKNKGKDMVPLWEKAKKTVDGGHAELKQILEDRRKNGEPADAFLKLELQEKELYILSMRFEMLITKCDRKALEESNLKDKSKAETLREAELLCNSKKAKHKLIQEFLCKDESCTKCQRSCQDQSSPTLSCILPALEPPRNAGFLIQYAFLTCVRAQDPAVREQAITTFRKLANLDDSQSDIKKMITMPLSSWQKLASNASQNELLSKLTRLLYNAMTATMKVSEEVLLSYVSSTIQYQSDVELKDRDSSLYKCILGQDGVFGFIGWFARFVVTCLGDHYNVMTPAHMWIFNADVCSALVTIYNYGTNKYPWIEQMLYNFNKLFSTVWKTKKLDKFPTNIVFFELQQQLMQKTPKKSIDLVPSIEYFYCDICPEKVRNTSYSKKMFPLLFETSGSPKLYPRQVTKIDRSVTRCKSSLSPEDMETCNREVLDVCSHQCLVKALSTLNPELHNITTIAHNLREKRTEGATSVILGMKEKILHEQSSIKYFSLKQIAEVEFSCKITKLDKGFSALEMTANQKYDAVGQRHHSPPPDTGRRSSLPSPTQTRKVSTKIPEEMQQYQENMLLHNKKDSKEMACDHQRVWGGWIRYHPLQDIIKYKETINDEGFSKSCLNFQIQFDTCDQIDINLLDREKRANILKIAADMNAERIDVFPTFVSELPVGYFREKCYKVVINEPNHLDEVAMKKIFSTENCLVGVWNIDFNKETCQGLVILKTDKTFFALLPHSPAEFWSVLTCDLASSKIHTVIREIHDVFTVLDKETAKTLPWATSCDKGKGFDPLLLSTAKSFALLQFVQHRARVLNKFSPNDGLKRFTVATKLWSKDAAHDDILDFLNLNVNGMKRFSARHLIGCPHRILWKGKVRHFIVDRTQTFESSCVTGWGIECRDLSMSCDNQNTVVDVPGDVWFLISQVLMIISVRKYNKKSEWMSQIDWKLPRPSIVIEMGSIPLEDLDDIRDENNITVSFHSITKKPKYAIWYALVDGKLMGTVFKESKEVALIHDMVREYTFETQTCMGSQFFGEKGTKDNSTGNFTFEPDDTSMAIVHNHSLGYTDKSLGNVLWTGEMLICFSQDHRPLGFERYKEVAKMIHLSLRKTRAEMNAIDNGAIKNSFFEAPTGHVTFCVHALIAGNQPQTTDFPDIFSSKSKEDSACFLAINIDQKTVEKAVGPLKKCYYFNVHTHDNTWLLGDLEEHKKTLLGFFLNKGELPKDIFKKSPEEMEKKFMILKYDHRMEMITAYVPKEKAKRMQVWEKLVKEGKQSHITKHEKMFKKLVPTKCKIDDCDPEKAKAEVFVPKRPESSPSPKFGARPKEPPKHAIMKFGNVSVMGNEIDDMFGTKEVEFKTTINSAGGEESNNEDMMQQVKEAVMTLGNMGILGNNKQKDIPASKDLGKEDKKVNEEVVSKSKHTIFKMGNVHVMGQEIDNFFNVKPKNTSPVRNGSKESQMDIKDKIAEPDKEEKKEKICWNCSKLPDETPDKKLSKCKGCHKARYCGLPCQQEDWGRHSSYCLRMQKKRKEKENKA